MGPRPSPSWTRQVSRRHRSDVRPSGRCPRVACPALTVYARSSTCSDLEIVGLKFLLALQMRVDPCMLLHVCAPLPRDRPPFPTDAFARLGAVREQPRALK